MVTALRVVALLAWCSLAPQHPWGILSHHGRAPIVASSAQIAAGTRLHAYELESWKLRGEVTVQRGARNEKSAVWVDGAMGSWEHEVSYGKASFPPDQLSICLPGDWVLVGVDRQSATIQSAGKKIGTVKVTSGEEGLNVAVSVGGATEELYYYFGYDIAPDAEGGAAK